MNINKKTCLEYHNLNNPKCEYIYEDIKSYKFYEKIKDYNREYIVYKVTDILKSSYYKDIQIIKLLYNSLEFIDHSYGLNADRFYIFRFFGKIFNMHDREYRVNIRNTEITCVSAYKYINNEVIETIYHYLDEELLLSL